MSDQFVALTDRRAYFIQFVIGIFILAVATLYCISHGFEYDPEKSNFRGWLFTAIRHAIGRHYKKQARRPLTAADTRHVRLLEAAPDEREQQDWERDYQREMLKWAMEKVRPEFADRIWNAFELTAVHGKAPAEVSDVEERHRHRQAPRYPAIAGEDRVDRRGAVGRGGDRAASKGLNTSAKAT